jgi:hypothetical protein
VIRVSKLICSWIQSLPLLRISSPGSYSPLWCVDPFRTFRGTEISNASVIGMNITVKNSDAIVLVVVVDELNLKSPNV